MSIWSYISELIERLNPLHGPVDPTKTSTFTIGVIALAAKLAKADGQVTRDEVVTFRQLFHVEPEDVPRIAKVYDFFRQDADNYEFYARQLKRLLNDIHILEDILDAMFAIAMADGEFHPAEEAFLKVCAGIFEVGEPCYATLQSRWVPERWDPWCVLDMAPTNDIAEVRRRYRAQVRLSHPDTMTGRGVPVEMIELSNRRLADLNRAYAEIGARAV